METARSALTVAKQPAAPEKGLTLVYYGDGKGKTTAALGAVLRAAGQRWQCVIIQFIKGSWPTSERVSIPQYLSDLVTIEAVGKGFVGIVDDRLPRETHAHAARDAVSRVREVMGGEALRLLVLDEVLDAVEFGFLSEDDILSLMRERPEHLHLILTGHKEFPRILEAADLVTRMCKEKHPYDNGRLAIRGLDY